MKVCARPLIVDLFWQSLDVLSESAVNSLSGLSSMIELDFQKPRLILF